MQRCGGNEKVGPLFRLSDLTSRLSLSAPPSSGMPGTAESLVHALTVNHRQIFSRESIQELASLAGERDPVQFYEGLFGLASRLEQENNLEASGLIFSAILEGNTSGPAEERLGALRGRAEQRLQILRGRGPVSTRIEFLARRFSEQATDLPMILGFGVAGGLAAMARQTVVTSLMLRTANWWTRGLGASGLAATAAYLTEVPAFVAMNRGMRTIFGDEAVSSAQGLGQELAGTALFLGTLRMTSILGGAAGEAFFRAPGPRSFLNGGIGLGGIYLAQRLQESWGIRRASDEANRWVDASDTWLQMAVGGRLWQDFAGNPRSMRMPAEVQAHQNAVIGTWHSPIIDPLIANRDPLLERVSASESLDATVLQLRSELQPRFGIDSVRQLEQVGRELGQLEALVDLARRSGMSDAMLFRGAVERLHHWVMRSDDLVTNGSYLGWVTRLALRETLRSRNLNQWDGLLERLANGVSLEDYEDYLGQSFSRIQRRWADRRAGPFEGKGHDLVEALPLSSNARRVLHTYFELQRQSDRLEYLNLWLPRNPFAGALFDRALVASEASPMAYHRVVRLVELANFEPRAFSKFYEMLDSRAYIRPWYRLVALEEGREISSFTQEDGYLGDPVFLEYLRDLQREIPHLIEEIPAAHRYQRSEALLLELWRGYPLQITPELLRAAFARLGNEGDPFSQHLSESLSARHVELVVLSPDAFLAEARRFVPDESGEFLNAFFLRGNGEHPVDRIMLKQIVNVSEPVFYRSLFNTLVSVVHEHEHHLRPPVEPPRLDTVYPEEMIAHLRALHWRARHGDIASLFVQLRRHPLGLGMYLRDMINQYYIRLPAGR